MSVKERYDALVAEQNAFEEAERQRIQAEKEAEHLRRAEAHKIWLEKKESEEPSVRFNLELKATNLRRFDILRMIGEFTDCNIDTLYSRHPKFQVKLTPKQIREWQERSSRHLRDLYGAKWEIRPVLPELNPETLIWENLEKVALDIRRDFRTAVLHDPHRVTKTEHVDLLYDGVTLAIGGEHEEFMGRIPQKRDQRIEIIESAFARAFFKPRIEVPEIQQRFIKRRSIFRGLDYYTPIGST